MYSVHSSRNTNKAGGSVLPSAGYGTLQIAMPDRGIHTCVDFCARAPAAARPDICAGLQVNETPDGYAFVVAGNVNEAGYQFIATPGTLAGLAHARDGVVVRPHMYQYGALDRAPGRHDRNEPQAGADGERLRNPDLTATLEHLTRAGAGDFYHGEIADRIVADMRAHGGLLSAADLNTYQVTEVAPL